MLLIGGGGEGVATPSASPLDPPLVIKQEEELVLRAYLQCIGGWNEILTFIKSQIASISGNHSKKEKTVEYYMNADNKTAIRNVFKESLTKI